MPRSNPTINVTLASDVDAYIKNLKKSFGSLSQSGISLGLDDSIQEEIKNIEKMFGDLQKTLKGIGGTKLSDASFEVYEKKVGKQIDDLNKRTTALETGMEGLMKTLSSADGGKMSGALQEIRKNMDNLRGTTQDTVEALKALNSTRANIQIADDDSVSQLQKAKELLESIQDLWDMQGSKLSENSTEARQKLEDLIQEYINLQKALKDTKPHSDEFAELEEELAGVLVQLRQYEKNIYTTFGDQKDISKIFGHTIKGLKASNEDILKSLDKTASEMLTNVKRQIKEADEYVEKSAKEVTRSEKGRGYKVPVNLSTVPKNLYNEVVELIAEVQPMLKDQNLEIGISLVTDWGNRKQRELFKDFQSKVGSIVKNTDSAEIKAIYDDITKYFNDEISVKIKSDVDVEAKHIIDKINEIRENIKKNPLSLDLNQNAENGKRVKQIFDKSVLNGLDELTAKLKEVQSVSKLTRSDLVKINDVLSKLRFPGVSQNIETLDKSFEKMRETLSKIPKSLNTKGKDKYLADLNEVLKAYKEYKALGGQKGWGELSDQKNVQNWFKNHINDEITLDGSKYQQAGRQLGEDYAAGIRQGISEVVKACQEMIDAALEAIRYTQQSNFPAKTTNKLANDFVNGTIQGLKEKIPEVQEAAEAINQAISEGMGAVGVDELISQYNTLLAKNNELWEKVNAGDKSLEKEANDVSFALERVYDDLESLGMVLTNEQGWISGDTFIEQTLDNARVSNLENEEKQAIKTAKAEEELAESRKKADSIQDQISDEQFDMYAQWAQDADKVEDIFEDTVPVLDKVTEGIRESVKAADDLVNKLANLPENIGKGKNPIDSKYWRGLDRIAQIGTHEEFRRGKDKYSDQQISEASKILKLAGDFQQSGKTEYLKELNSAINESSTLSSKMKAALKKNIRQIINDIQQGAEEAIKDETAKAPKKTKMVNMTKNEYKKYVQDNGIIADNDLFEHNFEQKLKGLQKKGLAEQAISKNGKLGRWKIQVEVEDDGIEQVTKKTENLSKATSKAKDEVLELSDEEAKLAQSGDNWTDRGLSDKQLEKELKIAERLVDTHKELQQTKKDNIKLSDEELRQAQSGDNWTDRGLSEKQMRDELRIAQELSEVKQELNKPIKTNESAQSAKKEADELDNVKQSAEKASVSKKEFSEANKEVLSSIINSLNGLNSEGKAFENLNKLINNLGGKNGDAKLKSTVEGLEKIVKVLSYPLDGSSFIDALEKIASSGSNLGDIATILKASNKNLLEAVDTLNKASGIDLDDILNTQPQEVLNAARAKFLELGGKDSQLVNISSIQRTKDNLLEIVGVIKTVDNQLQEFTLHSKDGMEMQNAGMNENTARLAKQMKAYAQVQAYFEKIQRQAANATDEIFVDPNDFDSDAWKLILDYLDEYADKLGTIRTITRSVDKDPQTGDFLESFRIQGDKGDITFGKAGVLLTNQKESLDDVRKKIGDLKKTTQEYYDLLEKQTKRDLRNDELEKLQRLEAEYKELEQEVLRYSNILKQNSSLSEEMTQAMLSGIQTYNDSLDKYSTKMEGIFDKALNDPLGKGVEFRPDFVNQVKQAQEAIRELRAEIKKHVSADTPWDADSIKHVEELREQIDKTAESTKSWYEILAKNANVDKLLGKINKEINDNSKMPRELRQQYEKLRDQIDEAKNSAKGLNKVDYNALTAQYQHLHEQLERIGKTGKSVFRQIADAASSRTAQMFARYFSFYDWIRYGRQAIDSIQGLDTALVDLRKTSAMSNGELNEFYMNSNKIAKQMGVTTEEIINQASSWSRLGYNTKEASESMAQLSSQFASISPGLGTDEAQTGLVSIMKAWDVDVDRVKRDIMDNINTLGNNFALTNADIIAGMERAGATLSAIGMDIPDSFALFTGAQEVVQNAETVGVALKTLSLRIRGYDEETEELSEDVIAATGKVADLTKVASNNFAGVSLWADAAQTQYRSLKDYLGDIAEIWDEIDAKSQTQILEKLFGKRGASVGSAILKNFDQVKSAIEAMEEAEGSADKEMSIIRDSIEYKLNALKQTWIGVFQELIDRGDLGKIVDGLTKVSEALGFVIDKVGLLNLGGFGLEGFLMKQGLGLTLCRS